MPQGVASIITPTFVDFLQGSKSLNNDSIGQSFNYYACTVYLF